MIRKLWPFLLTFGTLTAVLFGVSNAAIQMVSGDDGATSIEVSKTADLDGGFISGTISISNVGDNPAVINAITDSLEVHFPKDMTPPPLPEGSTPNWFKVADMNISPPDPIPVGLQKGKKKRETVDIPYSVDLCTAVDFSGTNAMRNVVVVTALITAGLCDPNHR